jgi:hypothetical protein
MQREDEKLTKHTFHLYDGDVKKLQDLHPEVGAAVIIRKLVRAHIEKIEGEKVIIKVEVNL